MLGSLLSLLILLQCCFAVVIHPASLTQVVPLAGPTPLPKVDEALRLRVKRQSRSSCHDIPPDEYFQIFGTIDICAFAGLVSLSVYGPFNIGGIDLSKYLIHHGTAEVVQATRTIVVSEPSITFSESSSASTSSISSSTASLASPALVYSTLASTTAAPTINVQPSSTFTVEESSETSSEIEAILMPGSGSSTLASSNGFKAPGGQRLSIYVSVIILLIASLC